MAKKLIPANVLAQVMNLSLEQVTAAMEGGGADVKLTSATFLGMMTGGAFIYKCEGTSYRKKWASKDASVFDHVLEQEAEWPDYLAEFKIKITHDKNFVKGYKPEFQTGAKRRVLENEYVLYWA